MTKHKDEKEVVKDFGNRPELAEAAPAPSMETLAHNWQPGSPAADMRDASSNIAGAINTVAALNAKEDEVAKKAKAVKVSAEEYKRRIALPVDDPQYINESLDHVVSE